MSQTIEVACQHCEEPIPFVVEDWAQPPKRAFCDETCHSQHEARVQEATATQA